MERQAPPGAGRTACSAVAARSGRQPVARRVEGGDRCRAAAAGAAGAGCGVARLAGCAGQRTRRATRRKKCSGCSRRWPSGPTTPPCAKWPPRRYRPAPPTTRPSTCSGEYVEAPHRRGAATGLLPAQCLAGPRRVRPGQAPRPALRRQRAADRAVERSQAGRETQRLAGAGARLPIGAGNFSRLAGSPQPAG